LDFLIKVSARVALKLLAIEVIYSELHIYYSNGRE